MAYQATRNQWVPEIKKLSDQLEKLEDSMAGTDECVVDIYSLEEKLDDRVVGLEYKVVDLEEELTAVKAENIELKNHLNSIIKELNGITALLNEKHGDLIEKTYELI